MFCCFFRVVQHHRGVRTQPGPGQLVGGPHVCGGDQLPSVVVAPCRHPLCRRWHPHPRLLWLAQLHGCLPPGALASQSDAGPARLLWRAHLHAPGRVWSRAHGVDQVSQSLPWCDADWAAVTHALIAHTRSSHGARPVSLFGACCTMPPRFLPRPKYVPACVLRVSFPLV